MKIENLIQIVQNLLDVNAVDFEFKVYDSLKMDNVQLDVNKVNGLARITTGSIDPILNLGQSSATMVVEFIYPYERLEAVRETLLAVSQNSAGLVVPNNTLDASLTGSTGVIISYPTQGNYFNGTMGETARSRLICYFDINEKSVLSNDIKLSIVSVYDEANKQLKGTYFKKVGDNYVQVTLPADYTPNTQYYFSGASFGRDYYELEYIESNGSQCIDLGIPLNNESKVQIDFDALGNNNNILFGTQLNENPLSQNFYAKSVLGTGNDVYYGSQSASLIIPPTGRYEYEIGRYVYRLPNYITVNVFNIETFATSTNLFVFADHKLQVNETNGGKYRLYKFKVYYNGNLVRDLVPFMRKADGKCGLYDKVNQEFLYDANDLNFTHGQYVNLEYYEENLNLVSDNTHLYFVKNGDNYSAVILPQGYTANTIYYMPTTWEDIPYYKYIITRHRLSTTNKYNNNKEMQTVNDGQSIDFSLAVPSIKGSVINSIKNDMLTGDNIGKTFTFRVIEEDGADNPKYFENMIASGDFSYEIVPGNVLLFKILFVYKRM